MEEIEMQPILLNDVLETDNADVLFRVIRIDVRKNKIWLFNVLDEKGLPKAFSYSEVEGSLHKGYIKRKSGTGKFLALKLSKTEQAYCKLIFSRIEPILNDEAILERETREKLIKQRAAEIGCSPQTIRSDFRKWWKNGQTLNALKPDFSKRGSVAGDTAGRGRPPKYLQRVIFQMSEKDRDIIARHIKSNYLKDRVTKLSDCYQTILNEHYSYFDNEGQRILKPLGEYPSEQQFRYYASKLLSKQAIIRSKKGSKEYELNFAEKLGSFRDSTYAVGEVYEIDATIADLWIVSLLNRLAIIGKATLYLIVDRKSTLIVGFYVGFENPSWPAAQFAIMSVSESKEKLCRRYGVDYDPTDWPADGIQPQNYHADRGSEFTGHNSTQLAENLNIEITNLSPGRARHKPFVECSFKLLHATLANEVKGYQPPAEAQKRQGKDYSEDAIHNLDELTRIILLGIIKHNRTPLNDYIWEGEHILNGIQPTPINIWNTSIRERAGILARIPSEQVRFALLPRMNATVTPRGIRIGACFYSCKEAIEREWFIAARRNFFEIEVRYDRNLVNDIYIEDDRNPSNFFEATLTDACEQYRGLSFAEAEALSFTRESLRLEGMHIKRQNNLDFHEAISPIVKKAQAEAKAAARGKTKPRTTSKKNVVKNRNDEKRRERQQKARDFSDESSHRQSAEVYDISNKKLTQPSEPNAKQKTSALSENEKARRKKLQDMLDGK
ncbi:MAG: transposase [Oxalobacter sp.]|nr:MAG: transposase [Oxalobacter sp.]